MSVINIWDEDEIRISFPKKKFQIYLKKIKVSSLDELSIEQKEKIFVTAISDFKKGKLALDELAEIGNHFWFSLKDKHTAFADALYECGELNFYVRKIPELEHKTGNFVRFMNNVMKYYEKHKNKNIIMKKTIDISKIKVKFGGKNEPKDEKLIKLLKDAYQGKLLAYIALVKIEGIKPFSDFKPQISEEYRVYFENTEKKHLPPPIHVYPKGEYLIMSDDYNKFYLYKEKNYSKITCVLLGNSESKYIIEKSDPFVLPPPKTKVINRSD